MPQAKTVKANDLAKDPVCGNDVNPTETSYASNYKGETYYFDSSTCQKLFDDNPEAYIYDDREVAA